MSELISRRGLITGLVSLVAAPAIVRASSLMPISAAALMPVWKEVELVEWNREYWVQTCTRILTDALPDVDRRIIARAAQYDADSIMQGLLDV